MRSLFGEKPRLRTRKCGQAIACALFLAGCVSADRSPAAGPTVGAAGAFLYGVIFVPEIGNPLVVLTATRFGENTPVPARVMQPFAGCPGGPTSQEYLDLMTSMRVASLVSLDATLFAPRLPPQGIALKPASATGVSVTAVPGRLFGPGEAFQLRAGPIQGMPQLQIDGVVPQPVQMVSLPPHVDRTEDIVVRWAPSSGQTVVVTTDRGSKRCRAPMTAGVLTMPRDMFPVGPRLEVAVASVTFTNRIVNGWLVVLETSGPLTVAATSVQ